MDKDDLLVTPRRSCSIDVVEFFDEHVPVGDVVSIPEKKTKVVLFLAFNTETVYWVGLGR
jgi:hypothetical protein